MTISSSLEGAVASYVNGSTTEPVKLFIVNEITGKSVAPVEPESQFLIFYFIYNLINISHCIFLQKGMMGNRQDGGQWPATNRKDLQSVKTQ